MEVGTRVWVKGPNVTRGAEAEVIERPNYWTYGDKFMLVRFESGGIYVCPLDEATEITEGILIPMTARGLNPGDTFYLSENRDFPDVMVEFITYVSKPTNTDPMSGDRSNTLFVRYKCHLGYAEDIVATTLVWIEVP